MKLIEVTEVSKYFKIKENYYEKLKNRLFHKHKSALFCALDNVSLSISPGEIVGIIGINGSGKSTISNILSSITSPTIGNVTMNGTVSILGVGTGLNGALTGAENIIQKCLLLGFSKQEINNFFDDIVAFAELEGFINQPVKNYSSGMKARLGFAIAIQVKSDVLIIDEALAVGDNTFYNKCVEEIYKMKDKNRAIIFISHSLGQIEQMCDRVIWLDFGKLVQVGDTKQVVNSYRQYVASYKQLTANEKTLRKKAQIKESITKNSKESLELTLVKLQRRLNRIQNFFFLSTLLVLLAFSIYFIFK